MLFFVEHVAHFVSIWEVITLREIILEKLVGMLVLLTCMLWAAAEKPYHDRVGGDLPECTGTSKKVKCRQMKQDGAYCANRDEEYLEDQENRIRIPSNTDACTGELYEGRIPKGKRPSERCKEKVE